ncbi:phosphatases II [Cylindrobasidium torrendii FP15055 ss-10]|uniref:protein-tyrosine-phosphatase n=1 Tax=Cylindrobasidium torrendii FP15055 ss-10 TaxID=1314674 RepID=A0A0D7BIQ1_9AGAR|nr:phosphatases II [Cylindrobasidium torrendii FP15055 ss-10]
MMILFDSVPTAVQQAMCTPMHLIIPPSQGYGALYLGSMAALYERGYLQSHNVRNVVQVIDAAWYPYLETDELENVYRIDILDHSSADLKPHLEKACDYIDRLLKSGKNVLVHCQQGISRSTSVVIAYLMRHRHMSYDVAFAFVQQHRACANPNSGFVKVLRDSEQAWLQPTITTAKPARSISAVSKQYV